MSAVEVMRCIRDGMQSAEVAEYLRRRDATAIGGRYELSGEETAALLLPDLQGLIDCGVHPFSLVQLSRVMRFDLKDAWAAARSGASAGAGPAGG